MRKRELHFQGVIIDSYAAQGGLAYKWKDKYTKGVPDLVAVTPEIGLHLVEVKHMPDLNVLAAGMFKNPLEPKQRDIALKYTRAGAVVLAAVVAHSDMARNTHLGMFPATNDFFDSYKETGAPDPKQTVWVPYRLGVGYDIKLAISHAMIGGVK